MNKGGSTAFTLVEVLIGMAIFGLIFASVATVLNRGFVIIGNARDNANINQLLQSEIENLRSLSWNDIENLPGQHQITPQAGFGTSINDRYNIERIINQRKPDQKEIIVSITWVDVKGVNHSRKFVTYYTRGGINDYMYRSF